MNIEETLQERGARYGSFSTQATIAQRLKCVMRNSPKWDHLDDDMAEALDMMANKVGRILNGDPQYLDSWHDLVGYFKLVEDRLSSPQECKHSHGTLARQDGTFVCVRCEAPVPSPL